MDLSSDLVLTQSLIIHVSYADQYYSMYTQKIYT